MLYESVSIPLSLLDYMRLYVSRTFTVLTHLLEDLCLYAHY